jgi:two-component system chemotaxis response regulator CheY
VSAKTVLIVDDVALMRTMLKRYVAMFGAAAAKETGGEAAIEVLEATDGQQALAAVAARKIDLIFLDLLMPGMDGVTFLERLARLPAAAAIPVVVTTALSEETGVDAALARGARSWIRKPFTMEAVGRELAAVLDAAPPRP